MIQNFSRLASIQLWLQKQPDYLLLSSTLIIILLVKAWLTSIAHLELHFDEALYWAYAQHLDWSYYEKGPLTAYGIAVSEALFGTGEWQIRLPGWLASCAFVALMFYFTRDVWRSRTAAWWSVVLLITTPTYFTIGLVITPDNLVWCFWTWGLWSIYKALFSNNRLAWYQTGLAVGLGALTKLSIGLLPAFVAIWMLGKKAWRHHFRNPHLWWALLLMLVIMSPLIYWNAAHDWGSFRHEQGHVSSQDWSIMRGLEFIASQLLVMSPVIMLMAIITFRKKPQDEQQFFLWALTIAWVLFFLFKAMAGKIQVNWPAASYISLLVLFAGKVSSFNRPQQRIFISGLLFSICFMIIYYFPGTIGLSSARVATIAKMKAWREPIKQLSNSTQKPVSFLLTNDYVIATELAFYWPTSLPVYITGSEKRRYNQYDFWPSIDREAGNNGLYVDTSPTTPELLKQAFASCVTQAPIQAIANDGSVVRTLYSHYCQQYKPIAWPKPKQF